MKVFGININQPPVQLELPNLVKDRVPEVKAIIPETKKPALIPKVKDPTLGYNTNRYRGRGHFQTSEYDLSEPGRIEDTDSYARQAFNKKTALLLKEGWTLTGKNPKTIKYIKARMEQIAAASSVCTDQLIRDIASALVRKSNCFLVKVRKTEASGGRVRREPNKKIPLKPVAAYFVAPAESMQYQLTGTKIARWRQLMPNGDEKFYPPRDVVHFFVDRKEGFIFGTPITVPVADDIRALRKIEENIELLVYQHLFPLFQYKVGTPEMPAGVDEKGRREIDVVRQEIMYMPTEGGIVTPERHEIKAIGAEGRAIRAEGYLDYFKKRVFSGLGVSAVDMGEGETANRATADNMSRNLIDSVKDLQLIIEAFFNDLVVKELLLESTFGDEALDEESLVTLKFKEIDVDAQIKKETHAADLFSKDVIDHDEARRRLGLEPWIVPSPNEVQSDTDTPEAYPQWHKSRWKMYELPKLLIQALDEPWSPAAKAAAVDSSLPMTDKGNEESAKTQVDHEVELEKERTKAKVAVAKATPKPKPTAKKKDGFLHNTFVSTKKDVVERIAARKSIDHDWIVSLVRTQMETTVDKLIASQIIAFRKGYASVSGNLDSDVFMRTVTFSRTLLRERAERYIKRLTNNVIDSLRRKVNNDMDVTEMTTTARAVFEAVEYRTKFIENVEINKSFNYGAVLSLRDQGKQSIQIKAKEGTSSTIAQSRDGQIVDLGIVTLEDIPPFHANDTTVFEIMDSLPEGIAPEKEKIDDPPDELNDETASCPECGKTAIKKKDTPDIYNCMACKKSFRLLTDDDEVNDSKAAYRRCVSKFKAKLRSRDPLLTDDELEIQAMAACWDQIKDEDEKSIEDATLEQCVLSTKKSLRKQHPDWSEDKIKSSAFAICNSQKKGK